MWLAQGCKVKSGPGSQALTTSFMLFSPPFLLTAASGLSSSCAHPQPSPDSLPLAVRLWSHSSSASFLLQWLFCHSGYFASRNPDSRLSDVERTLLVTCPMLSLLALCNLQTSVSLFLSLPIPSVAFWCLLSVTRDHSFWWDLWHLTSVPFVFLTLTALILPGRWFHAPIYWFTEDCSPSASPSFVLYPNRIAAPHKCMWHLVWLWSALALWLDNPSF